MFMKVPIKLEIQGNVCVFGGGREGFWEMLLATPPKMTQHDSAGT